MVNHLAQQAWAGQYTQYNPDYATNGWFTDPTQYDVSAAPTDVPMSVMYVRDDTMADETINGSIYE